MMEVQKQWVNVDGKWQHKDIPQQPASLSRTVMTSSPAPKLPPRTSTLSADKIAQSPALPPRRPSTHVRRPSDMALSRRDSNESMNSTATAETSLSAISNGTSMTSRSDRFTIRAPEYDPSTLPKLPPRKTAEEKEAETRAARFPNKSRKSSSSIPSVKEPAAVQLPERPQTRPPPSSLNRGNLPAGLDKPETTTAVLPSQPAFIPAGARQLPCFNRKQDTEESTQVPVPELPRRPQPSPQSQAPGLPKRQQAPPPPIAKRSALGSGFGNVSRPNSTSDRLQQFPALDGTPPPIPTVSKPDLAALQASKPKLNGDQKQTARPPQKSCLWCRDFSGPDQHAARFPRESLPSLDLGWLAQQLVAPFTSPTDKARVIFTWLHHNIAYDAQAFFSGNLKPSTPQSTLASGLAVCEGYAGLFSALSLKAGLESLVIVGPAKGYGHRALKPEDPIPPVDAGHAWNAVKIDEGVWKLVDPCWGAGFVDQQKTPMYTKRFAPGHFTTSNEDFGLSHYPMDPSLQYRSDGRIIGWEEYSRANKERTGADMCNGYTYEDGIAATSFTPVANPIIASQQGPTVRFTFQKVCPDWDPVRNGRGPYFTYVLQTEALNGTTRNFVPLQRADAIWWCDLPVADLGRPGQKVRICAVTKVADRDARGMSTEEYMRKRMGTSSAFSYLATWTIA